MQAETAYNVIEALSEKERKRLYIMLGFSKPKKKKQKKELMTDAQAVEILKRKLYKH